MHHIHAHTERIAKKEKIAYTFINMKIIGHYIYSCRPKTQLVKLQACLKNIKTWMSHNHLLLNTNYILTEQL